MTLALFDDPLAQLIPACPLLVALMLPVAAAMIVGDDSIKSALNNFFVFCFCFNIISRNIIKMEIYITDLLLLAVVYCGKKPDRPPLLLASVTDPNVDG